MKNIFRRITSMDETEVLLAFMCPGCKLPHTFRIKSANPKAPVWDWNGEMGDKATFSPSLLVEWPENRCHSFVRNGKIEFLNDCSHPLRGIYPLEPFGEEEE